jgi:hypothetical protein
MAIARSRSVLIVADHAADSPQLIAAVARRVQAGPCSFTLLVPRRAHGPYRIRDTHDRCTLEAEGRLAAALPLLSKAAGRSVVGMIGSHEPLATVKDALNLLNFDEVIISMLPAGASLWRRLDLPGRVRGLGLPVTEVVGSGRTAASVGPHLASPDPPARRLA